MPLLLLKMERNIKRFWDQFNILVWFIVVVEAFIFCLAIIHGHACGYKNSLIAHGILGLLVGVCLAILLLAFVGAAKCIDFLINRRGEGKNEQRNR